MRKFLLFSIFIAVQLNLLAQINIKSPINKNLYKTTQIEGGDEIFYESFDENNLPTNWTDTVFSNKQTWMFQDLPDLSFSEINSQNISSAICPWNNDTIGQNEWIISPIIQLPEDYRSIVMNFYAGFSRPWLNNANLEIWVGKFLEDTTIWTNNWNARSHVDTLGVDWTWHPSEINLGAYKGTDIKLGIRYTGNNGDLVAIDDIYIAGLEFANESEILTFSLSNQKTEAIIDAQNNTISVELIYGTDFNSIIPQFTISSGAFSNILSGDTIELVRNEIFEIKVTAEDSISYKTWQLTATEAIVNTEANIESFSIQGQTGAAIIDTKNALVEIEVDCHTDLSEIVPNIEISKAATILPAIGDTISMEEGVSYFFQIQAQDTSISTKWQIVPTVRDYTSNILSLTFANQSGSSLIDSETKTIFAELIYGTNLDSLSPKFSLSDCATSVPLSGDTISFENNIPKKILVYPNDSTLTATEWTVIVQLKENTLFNEAFDSKDSIPEEWIISSLSSNTWQIAQLPDFPFSSIYKLSKYSAFCPWTSSENQEEWLISPVISTQSFVDLEITDLKLGFYVGYNHLYSYGYSDLIVQIKTDVTDWTEVWKIPAEDNNSSEWYWHQNTISIDNYLGENIQLGFLYQGFNGDLIAIDNVIVYSNPFTGIKKNKAIDNWVKIYPNPASHYLYVESEEQIQLEIIDLSGRTLLKKDNLSNNSSVNIEQLKKGLYIAKFVSKTGKISTQKLQIQ